MVTKQIELSERQAAALERLASERGISVDALIREGVEFVLRSVNPSHREEIVRRALAASGRFHSDTGDLAARHDEYFAEASES